MTAYGDVIDEIVEKLNGFAATGDRIAFLSGDLADDDVSISLDDAAGFSRGLIEIDSEMIYVKSYDQQSNSLMSGIRGYRGTSPTDHTQGTPVFMQPSWPRSSVGREINNQINQLYPTLFAVGTTSLVADAITYQYDVTLPAERIVDVRWLFNTLEGWRRGMAYELDQTVPGASCRINFYDPVPASTQIQVLYAKRPATLSNETDAWSSTGLPDSVKDLVVLGVVAQMAQYIDVSRLPVLTAEADANAGGKQLGSGMQIAAQFRQQYGQRLAEEQQALTMKYPPRVHKVR